MTRLAVVTTHPIQYYAPWFRRIAARPGLDLRVFYLWDFGVAEHEDEGFRRTVRWDVPLLDGYASEFVPNVSRRPATRGFRGIDNPGLPAALRSFDPAAVLCIGYKNATFFRLMLRRPLGRVPLLHRGDSHRLVPRRGLSAGLRRRVLSLLFRRFRAFLYVGAANRDYLRMHGVPDERLFFCPHAVDNDRFSADPDATRAAALAWRRELGIPADKAVVLFAGKLEEKKRPLDLLRAFARAAVPGGALLFVGNGHLDEAVRREAALVPHVYFAPFQNQSVMPRTYAAGDVVVLPSFGSGETWGLCVNEAQCLARPVVVSTHVGCAADLVTPGETGWVFPAGDVDALAGCLREALADRSRLRAVGEAGRERVRRYSYGAATDGLVDALKWLSVGSPHTPAAVREDRP
jgi:glycosyltransferase involved in cell wall biosynthesis